jgi:type IV pilus biogenesis protein CpaD/CtpE
MKSYPYPIVAAAMLVLAACRPPAAEYTESEALKRITLDSVPARIELHFAPGSDQLLAADAERLRRLAASQAIAPADRVMLWTSGGPGLAQARRDVLSAELLRYGIVVTGAGLAALPRDRAILAADRTLVSLPSCPNWSQPSEAHFANTMMSNFGCATAMNFGQMVASPTDMVSGEPLGPAAGIPASAAVQRYLADRVRLPISTTLGPISATSTSPPGGEQSGTGGAAAPPTQ